jgi:putative transposase
VPIGERHLRAVVREYVEHYHHERNHQGLDNVIPLPLGQSGKGAIRRHERLGGVLGNYRREAA